MRNLLIITVLSCFFLSIHGMSCESFENSSEYAESSSPYTTDEENEIKMLKKLNKLLRSPASLNLSGESENWLEIMKKYIN